jgi:hypothetical protein
MGKEINYAYDYVLKYKKPLKLKKERKMKSPIWTTKDGRQIPINQLSSPHLQNIIEVVDRMNEVLNGNGFSSHPLTEALKTERYNRQVKELKEIKKEVITKETKNIRIFHIQTVLEDLKRMIEEN